MRDKELDNVVKIEELTKIIADLEDVNKICIAEAHRASRENEEFKGKIAFLEEKIAYLESELRSASRAAKNAGKPQSTAQPNSSDLLYFLEATRASEALKQDRAEQKSSSSNSRKNPNLSELWSEATDFPIIKKRAKLDKHSSDSDSKNNRQSN